MRPEIVTVGHGTLEDASMISLLQGAGVQHVVDVRSLPGSRRNPQYGRQELERWLPAAGIAYSWEPRLGGRRRAAADSPNTALRNEAFKGYADWMGGGECRSGLDSLLEISRRQRTAVMCSETLWWKCHRRLLADALVLLRATGVLHLFHSGRLVPHEPTPEARIAGQRLVYDAGGTIRRSPAS